MGCEVGECLSLSLSSESVSMEGHILGLKN